MTETASNAIMFLIFARSIFLYKKTGKKRYFATLSLFVYENFIVSKCVAINRKTSYVTVQPDFLFAAKSSFLLVVALDFSLAVRSLPVPNFVFAMS